MSWTAPDAPALFAALSATWPAAETAALGGWVLRRGHGGGQRASSVWPQGDPGRPLEHAIDAAEAAMRGWDQPPLFQIGAADAALDAALAARGYRVASPCVFLAAPAETVAAAGTGGRMVVRVRAPLALLDEFWAAGGIDPARRAVMARAAGPKEVLIVREDDRVAAAAFVAVHERLAVMSALLVGDGWRRRGVGRAAVAACAAFGAEAGAESFALSVETANAAARALYGGLGMVETGGYHYRAAPEEPGT